MRDDETVANEADLSADAIVCGDGLLGDAGAGNVSTSEVESIEALLELFDQLSKEMAPDGATYFDREDSFWVQGARRLAAAAVEHQMAELGDTATAGDDPCYVDGELRFLAAKRLGLPEIPVIVIGDEILVD